MLKKYVADRINGNLVFFKDLEDPKKEKWLYRVDPEKKEPVKPKTVLNEMAPFGHLFKKVHPEQAQKLDVILGFEEQCGNSSESVRRMLEDGPENEEKGLTEIRKPLISLVAGAGFEPTTFGL